MGAILIAAACLALTLFLGMLWCVPDGSFFLALRNAYRADASLSPRRLMREARAVVDLFVGFFLCILFVLGPGLMVVSFIHLYAAPLPLLIEGVEQFSAAPGRWEQNLKHGIDLDRRHEEALRARGESSEEARAWQRFLWHQWPLIVGITFLLTISGAMCATRLYRIGTSEFARQVTRRRQQYQLDDLSRLPHESFS